MAIDVAIDLGTSRTRILLPQKGIVTDEPSVITVHKRSETVVAVGQEAYRMLGRTPPSLEAVYPLQGGVIAHFDLTEAMLDTMLKKVVSSRIRMPRIAVCVPSRMTDVEKRAVVQVVSGMGVRQVQTVEAPLAAAKGDGVNISRSHGVLVVDVGGGTTDMAVISLNGTAVSRSTKYAGRTMDDAILQYIRQQHHLLIGQRTAESLKHRIGCVQAGVCDESCTVRGKSLLTGLPSEVVVRSDELVEPLQSTAAAILKCLRDLLEATPPELMADIHTDGLLLTGGAARIGGLAALLRQSTGLSVRLSDEPELCTIWGLKRRRKTQRLNE